MSTWQLQEAKAHLSAVVKKALTQGPQDITLRGEPAVVVISKADLDKLKKPKLSFVQFMRSSPLAGVKLDLQRNKSFNRKVEL